MTEEKLSASRKTSRIGPLIRLFIALLGIPAAVLWLTRQPIMELLLRQACQEQGLSCRLSVTRLDFSGFTLTSVDVRAPGAAEAALRAQTIAVGLVWEGPLSVRVADLSGDTLALRLDLTGGGPIAGDLDRAVTTLMQPSPGPSAPPPLLDFQDIAITTKTRWGELIADAHVVSDKQAVISLEASIRGGQLAGEGLTAMLARGDVSASVKDSAVLATMTLDLTELEQGASHVSDLLLELALEQSIIASDAAVAVAAREAGKVSLPAGESPLSGEAGGFWPSAIGRFLSRTEGLKVSARAGAGTAEGFSWTNFEAYGRLQPTGEHETGGPFAIHLEGLQADQLVAAGVDVTGEVVASEHKVSASGRAQARKLILSDAQTASLRTTLTEPLRPLLPKFSDAAGSALGRAVEEFDVTSAWRASASHAQLRLDLTDEAVLVAASGLRARIVPAADKTSGFVLDGDGQAQWTGAGDVYLSGGGAPDLHLHLARLTDVGGMFAMDGQLDLSAATADGDRLSASLLGLRVETSSSQARAAAEVRLRLDGALAGGRWNGLEARADITATGDGDALALRAPAGVEIAWTDAVYADARLGAGALVYQPDGLLAAGGPGGFAGRGELSNAGLSLAASSLSIGLRPGAASIVWRAGREVHAALKMRRALAALRLDADALEIDVDDIAGDLILNDGWRLTGSLSGGVVASEAVRLSDLAGRFDLEGEADAVTGSLTEVTSRITDARPEPEARFSPADFSGRARLADGLVEFDGRLRLVSPRVELAHVTGRHSLADNSGSLTFNRTQLQFSRRTLQPSHLSRLLTGPARVNGRVDISGEASWGHDDIRASATLDLQDVGFALAAAGVFEGVSGRIEISDLFSLHSQPGQTLIIDKVTFGLPIEDGRISFQLDGYDRVRIEGAQWPFLDGYIRVLPAEFIFASTAENGIHIQAIDLSLARLGQQLNLSDLSLEGTVGGDFPILFSAGSAQIRNAVLTSGGPGVIHYGGAVSQSVADSEPAAAIVMDALKDFRFDVLEIGLDGNLAGKMMLTLDLLGRNPAVMGGRTIALGVSIDSYLSRLLGTLAPDARPPLGPGAATSGTGPAALQERTQ